MRELSASGIARMRNQIHFRETRCRYVPAIGLHRNVVLEQVARVGPPLNPSSPLRLLRFQPTVHLSRTDLQQLLFNRRPHAKTLADPRQPQRQQRLQSHRPRIPCGLPHGGQHSQGFRTVTEPAPPLPSCPSLLRPRPIQQANRILAVIAGVGTELAQDHLLGLSSCFPIALINRPQILPSPLVSQPVVSFLLFWLGYILNGATLSPSVTFCMTRYAVVLDAAEYARLARSRGTIPAKAGFGGVCFFNPAEELMKKCLWVFCVAILGCSLASRA